MENIGPVTTKTLFLLRETKKGTLFTALKKKVSLVPVRHLNQHTLHHMV